MAQARHPGGQGGAEGMETEADGRRNEMIDTAGSKEYRVQSSVVADNKKLNPQIKKYCDDMFAYLVRETNLPIGYIDVVLWKSCQNKLIIMDDYL